MLTHRNVLMNAYYTGERLRYTAADRVCVPVPFYHCFGCVLGTMACVVYGSAIVVPAPSFDARSHAGRDRRRALHVGLRRADDVCGAARTSRFRTVRPDEPAHRNHVGCSLSVAADGEGREPDGHPRDLHRLRPDRGLAAHHVHLGRRPDRGPRRHGRASASRVWKSSWSTRRAAARFRPARRASCVSAGIA